MEEENTLENADLVAESILAEVKKTVGDSRLVRNQDDLVLVRREDVQIRKLLGKGAFSDVHEVKVKGLYGSNGSRTVAMKHVKRNLMWTERHFILTAAELAVEAHLLASFNHPNILKIRGWALNGVKSFRDGRHDSFFLLLDKVDMTLNQQIEKWLRQEVKWTSSLPPQTYVYNTIVSDAWKRQNGGSDDEKVEIKKRLKKEIMLNEKLRICYEIASALAYLHEKGVIFRDLKPSNIGLINGRIQLFDFGLSRELPDGQQELVTETYNMSGKVGTFRYMAVEIACNQPYNVSADVYSWAMVCYEIMSMKKPFGGYTSEMHAELVCSRGARPELRTQTQRTSDQHTIIMIPQRMKNLLKASWHQEAKLRPSMDNIRHNALMQSQEQTHVVELLQQLIDQQKKSASGGTKTTKKNVVVEFMPYFREDDIRKSLDRNLSGRTSSTTTSSLDLSRCSLACLGPSAGPKSKNFHHSFS